MPEDDTETVIFRNPRVGDGAAMWRLVSDSGSLDLNSPYVYLMGCLNFADTCVVAEFGGELAGMVLAYRQPSAPDVLFVWQIGVAQSMRGRGLGVAMLAHLIETARPAFTHLETTITPSNAASEALFRAFARRYDAPVAEETWLAENDFPDPHEAERMFRIGPLKRKE